jgi:hypothetical protein
MGSTSRYKSDDYWCRLYKLDESRPFLGDMVLTLTNDSSSHPGKSRHGFDIISLEERFQNGLKGVTYRQT